MLIDSHCHLDFPEFDADREAVMQAAAVAGVGQIVVPGVTRDSWQRTIRLCSGAPQKAPQQKVPALLMALGLHPIFIGQHQPQHLSELDTLLASEAVVAVGEIGLDYYLAELDRDKQDAYFLKQLIIAKRYQLPAIIHNRKAHDQCLKMLAEQHSDGGIIHAFNGSLQQAYKYIEMGFVLGFGGMLTYARSSKLRRLVKELPLEHIVLETDAPDMTVSQHRGQRNSPQYLPYVMQAVAQIRDIPEQTVAATSSAAVRRVLRL